MPICGTKLASFGIVISLWGAVQLSLTGLALSGRSIAFIDDVAPSEEYTDSAKLLTDLEARYDASALNCWIAALIYLGTLAISAAAFYANSRVGEVPKEPLENFASING